MNITVVIAGVRDPKWPFDSGYPRVLSPFDAAALELALQLKDARPTVEIAGLVFGRPGDESLVRAVTAVKVDRAIAIHDPAERQWNFTTMAQRIWRAIQRETPQADLLLLGRQFGDLDDSSVPACLAEHAQRPFVRFAHCLSFDAAGAGVIATRERGLSRDHIACPAGAIVSVTNDRANRLRYPLLKNVMMAKKSPVTWGVEGAVDAGKVDVISLEPTIARPSQRSCVWIEGSAAERAVRLARLLAEVAA